ncbi:inorganic diphosphatase [Streptomyces atratus]|uniref:inorganic diphosphatase n=1 Tax=Streptomyces atratus TaxID=1893 RepID=UPI0033D11506
MSRIAIAVDATVGSTVGRDDESATFEPDAPPAGHGAGGRPVGHGRVPDTLGDDGRPLEALVLMREPAVPGADIPARPVGVLHLAAQGRTVDEMLCVAEDECFTGIVDLADLPRRHAEPGGWAAALARIAPASAYRIEGCGPAREADELLDRARHACLQLTGCLE